MPYKRKFKKGAAFICVQEFDIWTRCPGGRYVYFNHKLLHPLWVRNMSYGMIAALIYRGVLFRAENNDDSI